MSGEKVTVAQLTNEIVLASEELEKAEIEHREARSAETSALNREQTARKRLAAAKKALDERVDPKTKG